ncbi:hypothetical protein ACT4MK_22295 [Bradyrhizobium barranii]|uniref:hypothetical protein n=1 Tax=Bradyrhizobium barranii TaxID=2992140 RepID=UPI004033D1A4
MVAAVTAGVAGLISNGKSIGEALGLIKSEDPLVFTSSSLGMKPIQKKKERQVTVAIRVSKSVPAPARNCRVESERDGYQVPLKLTNYGPSFSLPNGTVTRDVTVWVSPIIPHVGLNSPTVAVICDNMGSGSATFEWGRSSRQ